MSFLQGESVFLIGKDMTVDRGSCPVSPIIRLSADPSGSVSAAAIAWRLRQLVTDRHSLLVAYLFSQIPRSGQREHEASTRN